MRTLIVLMLVAVSLAGCSDSGDAPPTAIDPSGPLAEGTGAIAGLVIDDAFRPIPNAEVLVQETGAETTANENGEFFVVDLEPATYTIRITAEGHEAAPFRVQVTEGAFAEANIVARRTVSLDDVQLTQEFVVFLDCVVSAVVALPFDCSTDLSGDSHRRSFVADYTGFGPDATALVMEMKAAQEKRYEVDIWWPDGDDIPFYANDVFTGDYAQFVLKHGETNTEDEAIFTNDPWINEYPLLTEIIVFGALSEEGGQVDDFFLGGGVGVHFAVKAQFLHTLFLGDTSVDVDSYCVLC